MAASRIYIKKKDTEVIPKDKQNALINYRSQAKNAIWRVLNGKLQRKEMNVQLTWYQLRVPSPSLLDGRT